MVNPAPFVVDQRVSGSFVGSLRFPAHAEEQPKSKLPGCEVSPVESLPQAIIETARHTRPPASAE
jgi:hypothetical protein